MLHYNYYQHDVIDIHSHLLMSVIEDTVPPYWQEDNIMLYVHLM